MARQEKTGSRKSKRKWIIGGIVAAVLVVAIAAGFLLGNNRNAASNGLKVQKNTVEWNQDMKSADEDAGIQIPYYSDVYMKGGTDTIDMTLVNPKENDCYFTYTFILSDTGEEIYQSDLIGPGRALEQVKLNQEVPNGTYKLNIRVDTYTMEDQETLNNAIVATNLIAS